MLSLAAVSDVEVCKRNEGVYAVETLAINENYGRRGERPREPLKEAIACGINGPRGRSPHQAKVLA